jgi:hypothetical protein
MRQLCHVVERLALYAGAFDAFAVSGPGRATLRC